MRVLKFLAALAVIAVPLTMSRVRQGRRPANAASTCIGSMESASMPATPRRSRGPIRWRRRRRPGSAGLPPAKLAWRPLRWLRAHVVRRGWIRPCPPDQHQDRDDTSTDPIFQDGAAHFAFACFPVSVAPGLLSLLRLYRDEQTLQVTFFIGAPPGKVRDFKSRGFALQRPYASGRKLKRMRWKHRLAHLPALLVNRRGNLEDARCQSRTPTSVASHFHPGSGRALQQRLLGQADELRQGVSLHARHRDSLAAGDVGAVHLSRPDARDPQAQRAPTGPGTSPASEGHWDPVRPCLPLRFSLRRM